jgi:hypothetical protein
MTKKGSAAPRRSIPVDYIAADPNGNRRSRRLARREAAARARGRGIGHSSGGDGSKPLPVYGDDHERT